jgi:hypothetical protein
MKEVRKDKTWRHSYFHNMQKFRILNDPKKKHKTLTKGVYCPA